LDYVHAHFTGHLLGGLLVLLGYVIVKRNKPFVNSQVMVPAMISGAMWGIGCTLWFMSNNYVSQAISFPINSMVPGCCAALWSTFLFREIRGARNYVLTAFGIASTIVGAIIVGASS
uniref:Ammonium_transp domain-containing protein n=1 Tax=Gongylonema pulchrum TaxID=637853 RepID=A0A183ESN3_9BILA